MGMNERITIIRMNEWMDGWDGCVDDDLEETKPTFSKRTFQNERAMYIPACPTSPSSS